MCLVLRPIHWENHSSRPRVQPILSRLRSPATGVSVSCHDSQVHDASTGDFDDGPALAGFPEADLQSVSRGVCDRADEDMVDDEVLLV